MKQTILPILFVLLALPTVALAGEEAGASKPSSHRAITWQDPASGEELRGLYLIELDEDRMVSMVLAKTPRGRHVLLTQTLDARTGLRTTSLVDEQTGWRAELETDTGARAPSLSALFKAAEEVDPGEPVTVRLVLSGQDAIEAEIPVDLPSEMQRKFVEQLAVTGSTDRVALTIPEGLRPTLSFLERSLSPNVLASEPGKADNIAHGLRDIVEVLTGALRIAGATPTLEVESSWPMVVGPSHKGLEVQSPELRNLVSHFEKSDLPMIR